MMGQCLDLSTGVNRRRMPGRGEVGCAAGVMAAVCCGEPSGWPDNDAGGRIRVQPLGRGAPLTRVPHHDCFLSMPSHNSRCCIDWWHASRDSVLAVL
jgi:hypothetical protein